MVVRSTRARNTDSNPLKSLSGYRKAVNAALDQVDRRDGELPNQVTVEGLTLEEIGHVVASFRRNHYRRDGERIVLYPARIVRDLFDAQPGRLLDSWYAQAHRTPHKLRTEHANRIEALRQRLSALPDIPVRAQLLDDLDRGKGWITGKLERYGIDAAAVEAQAVVTTISLLPLASPTRIRTFAANHLHDSHRLDPGTETYLHLTDLLLAATPVSDEDESPLSAIRRQVLEDQNLVPNLTQAKALIIGNLHLRYDNEVDEKVVRNTDRVLATALTLDELLKVDPAPPLPSIVFSIENETPFNEIAARVPEGVLVVMTSGQPNAAVRRLLGHLALRGVPHYHWGDIDAGGYQILRELNRLAPTAPFLMDEETVRTNSGRLTRMTARKRRSIQRFLEHPPPESESALRACLELDGWLEQESIPIENVREFLLRLPTEVTGARL